MYSPSHDRPKDYSDISKRFGRFHPLTFYSGTMSTHPITVTRSINGYSVTVPVELIDFIFEQACTADNLTQIDTIIQSRRAIRLVSKQYRSFVDQNPAFWTSILITTATPLHAIDYLLRKPAELPVHITLRIVDGSGHSTVNIDLAKIEAFITDAANLILPRMHKCTSFVMDLQDPILADFILSTFMHCNTSSLQRFTFRFFVKRYDDFEPAPLSIFAFSQRPLYGRTSAPSQVLSISPAPWSGYCPILEYVHSNFHVLEIRQPRSRPMDWRELGVILTHSRDLQVLILDAVEIYTPASYLDWPCEIPGLTTLDLVFQGKEPMAKFVSQMQLPALTTLKITLADNDDVQHLMRCGEMLRGITYLSLRGQCDDNINVHLLYKKMPNLRTLDLQRAGPCFFSAFLEASAMGNPCTGINWNACPSMADVACTHIDISDLQYLVAVRELSAYDNLNCLWLVTDAVVPTKIVKWFENRNTRFQFFNEAKPDFLKVAE
ncbi:hypothetical protein C8J57DRAFT_1726778 [Mycena rebaudengoi]|nr:hypothetical protein C8J57DRAFT_1726778 [Mycena rebaudengoi]